jgi:uncharacterized RDD family membrane protein YckC
MFEKIQKANIWKRISAYLFDVIIIFILLVGVAYVTSVITSYDDYTATFEERQAFYEEKHGIDFDITKEIYNGLSAEDKAKYPADYLDKLALAQNEFSNDKEAARSYAMIFSLIVLIASVGIIVSFLVYEFAVPLFLGNGQTLGKKIFGVAVMRTDCVKITGPILFARAMLGKCTVELLLPLVMIFSMGLVGTVCAIGITLFSIILILFTQNRSAVHDALAHTVVVDFASQRIFDTVDDLVAYKNKIHAELISDLKE